MLKRYTGGEWVEQGGGGGTNDYADLSNKPKINNTTLSGNKTSSDLGLQPAINGYAKVNADYIDDSTSTNKFVTASDKTNWNAKLGPGDTYTKQELDDEFTEINNAIDAVEAGAAAGATALQPEDVSSTYSSSGTAPINGTGVAAALSTLDVTAVGGSGKYLSQISEVDGKIVPVVQTMDSTPTEESYKAISSDGVWADQQRQEIEMGDIVNRGAKNLLEVTSQTQTINGVTFTVNADQTITMNGTSQESAQFLLRPNTVYAGMQGCILSGAVQNNQNIALIFQRGASPWTVYASDSGNGAVIQDYDNNSPIHVYINVPAGVTVSNLVFKPMIRSASITDSTFVPYAKNNRDLTVENESQQSEINYAVNTGVKNISRIDITSGTYIGFTVTATRDTVTVESGSTAPSPTANFRILTPSIALKAGTYEITGCPATGTDSTYRLDVRYTGSSGTDVVAADYGSGKSFTLAQDSTVGVFMRFERGYTVTTPITFRPMLCLKSLYDGDNSYQPYARPNPALTAEMDHVVNTGAKNFLDVQHPTTTTRTSYQPLANGGVELSCSNATWTSYTIANIPVEAGKEYIITFLLDESSGTSNFYFFLRNGNSSGTNLATKNYGSTTGRYEASFIPNSSVIWLGIYLNNSATAATATAKLRCMIRDAAITDSTYEPYALSNPILTPALIEQVDSGAKNLLQLFQLGSSNANVGNPCTSQGVEYEIQSDGTITAYRKSSASSGAYIFLYKNGAVQNVSEFFDGNHIWSGNPPQYPDGGVSVWYKIGSGSNITLPNGALLPNANGEAVQIGIQISTSLSPTQSNPIVFKPMICTAADWAVSQKFVPYAMSNSELTEKKADFLKKTVVTSGNLDDISTNEFALYTTDVAGKPQSGYAFVRTSVYDSNAALQELTMLSGNSSGRAYVRVKYAGTWTAWKETTT